MRKGHAAGAQRRLEPRHREGSWPNLPRAGPRGGPGAPPRGGIMADPVASRSLAWVLRHLVRAATWLLGVVVGVLCGIGVVYLGVLGTLLVAGLSTGLGLLVVSASRARPDAPVRGLVA